MELSSRDVDWKMEMHLKPQYIGKSIANVTLLVEPVTMSGTSLSIACTLSNNYEACKSALGYKLQFLYEQFEYVSVRHISKAQLTKQINHEDMILYVSSYFRYFIIFPYPSNVYHRLLPPTGAYSRYPTETYRTYRKSPCKSKPKIEIENRATCCP